MSTICRRRSNISRVLMRRRVEHKVGRQRRQPESFWYENVELSLFSFSPTRLILLELPAFPSLPSCARESGLFSPSFCAQSFLGVKLGETRRRPAKPKNSWSHVVPNTIVEPLWWQNAHFRTFSSFGEGKKGSTQKRSNPPIFARTLGWIKLLAFLNTALFSLYLLSNSFLIIFAEFSFPCGVPLYNGLQGSRQL